MGRPKKTIEVVSGGLGSDIANVLEKTGVKKIVELFTDGKDCGCKEREEKLNSILPHKYKARCMTEQEYNDYKEFVEVRTLTLSHKQVEYVVKLHNSIFNRFGSLPCSSCNPKALIAMIDKLDIVFKSYEETLV